MPTFVASTISLLNSVINAIRSGEIKEGDDAQKTLLAVVAAARATNRYEDARFESGIRDHEKERDLADLWAQAAVYVSRHSGSLAQRLEAKGEYWMNPDALSGEEIRAMRIGLDQVTADADQLLNPKIRRGSYS